MQLAAAIFIAALLLIPEETPITDDNRALGSNKSCKSLSKSSKPKSSKSSKSKSSKSSKSKSSKSSTSKSWKPSKSKRSKSSKSKSSNSNKPNNSNKSNKSKSSKSSKSLKSSKSKQHPQENNIFETQKIEIDGICGTVEEIKEDFESAVLDFFWRIIWQLWQWPGYGVY